MPSCARGERQHHALQRWEHAIRRDVAGGNYAHIPVWYICGQSLCQEKNALLRHGCNAVAGVLLAVRRSCGQCQGELDKRCIRYLERYKLHMDSYSKEGIKRWVTGSGCAIWVGVA